MVLVHIVTKDNQQAEEIAEYLLKKKLMLNAMFSKVTVMERQGESVIRTKKVLIMGKTKALLFNMIDKELLQKYGENMPELYTVAIVNMDWQQADKLVNETEKV